MEGQDIDSDIRRLSSGEMIYKSQLASSIASIITGSFNDSNSESILVYDSQVGCPNFWTPKISYRKCLDDFSCGHPSLRVNMNYSRRWILSNKMKIEKNCSMIPFVN